MVIGRVPLVCGFRAAWLAAALLAFASSAGAQGTYIPSVPQSDSLIYPEDRKDPRIAPHDAHNPWVRDPHSPKNLKVAWASNDYFAIGTDPKLLELIPIVENVHFGVKSNPRGFWPKFLRQQYNYALDEMKYVLWVFPNHPRALHMLGVVSRLIKDPTIPIAYYEKAMRLFPNHAYTYAQYGAYLVSVGEKTQGIMQLQKALQMDPELLAARAWLDKAKRDVGLDVAAPGQSTAPAPAPTQPVQMDGMYVPRR